MEDEKRATSSSEVLTVRLRRRDRANQEAERASADQAQAERAAAQRDAELRAQLESQRVAAQAESDRQAELESRRAAAQRDAERIVVVQGQAALDVTGGVGMTPTGATTQAGVPVAPHSVPFDVEAIDGRVSTGHSELTPPEGTRGPPLNEVHQSGPISAPGVVVPHSGPTVVRPAAGGGGEGGPEQRAPSPPPAELPATTEEGVAKEVGTQGPRASDGAPAPGFVGPEDHLGGTDEEVGSGTAGPIISSLATESGTVPKHARTLATLRPLPRVMAVANQKGGVGKTTTTVNLGAALAELGYRVLVVDLDPQGNATTGLGIDARNFELSMYDVIMRDAPMEDCIEPTSVKNLFVAPATIDLAGVEIELVPAFSREMKLKKAIDSVVDDFDFALIDCPPSLGLITINGLAAAGEVLVPIQCEYYALEGLGQLLRNVHLVESNLNSKLEVSTIVLTMYDARTRLAVDVAGEVREHFPDKVCRSVIPRTVRISEAPSFGQPITVFDPTSRGAVAYRELAKEVSNGAPQRAG